MRMINPLLTSALFSLISLSAFAWTTVDDFKPAADVGAMVMSMKTHERTGKTFAVGFQKTALNATSWIIRESNNHGQDWKTVDNFIYPGAIRLSADSITEDAHGTLYAQGIANLGPANYRYIIRASKNSGNSWDTITDEPLTESWSQFSLASDSTGGLYSAGSLGSFGRTRWVVRRRSAEGMPWQLVDTFNLTPGLNATVMGITVDSQNRVFVVGHSQGKDGYSRLIVRRSIDSGTTWTTVDQFQMALKRTARGYGIAAGDAGLFVVGLAMNAFNQQTWIVRRSQDGGTTWSTVEQTVMPNGGYAFSVTADSGNVYVVGNNGRTWQTRASSDQGATWQTVDSFDYNVGTQSVPRGVCSSRGDVFVGGVGQTAYHPDPTRNSHWLIRKN